jgi:hypothetical protein
MKWLILFLVILISCEEPIKVEDNQTITIHASEYMVLWENGIHKEHLKPLNKYEYPTKPGDIWQAGRGMVWYQCKIKDNKSMVVKW